MELHEILERLGAPGDLAGWVREGLTDLEQAWERCERPDHRIWLAACAGTPIEGLIEAAAAAVAWRVEELVDPAEPVLRALELSVNGAPAAALLEVAEACERVARGGVGTYRSTGSPEHASIAQAAGLVARAAEGLLAGEARQEAGRLEQARRTGALIGVGTQVALPARAGPARLDVLAAAHDPAHGMFLFAVAASAEAVAEMEAGRAASPDGRELDRLIRRTLESYVSG